MALGFVLEDTPEFALGFMLEDTPEFALIFICLACLVVTLVKQGSTSEKEKADALLCWTPVLVWFKLLWCGAGAVAWVLEAGWRRCCAGSRKPGGEASPTGRVVLISCVLPRLYQPCPGDLSATLQLT